MENKQIVLDNLVKALIHTLAGCDVEQIKLADNGETAIIYFINGDYKCVNIACDSAVSAIIDVCKALL